jgi:hypothetical protein
MTTIIPTLIAAMVAAAGWFVANYLIGRREDRTKRLQLTMEQSATQISEFYAPLLGLLEQLDTIDQVKEDLVTQEPEHYDMIAKIFYDEFFYPRHLEIVDILKHKIHLLEGYNIPQSVREYFKHFASENIYWRLTNQQNIKTSVKAKDFPEDFPGDLQINLENVIKRYESAKRELEHGAVLFRMRKPGTSTLDLRVDAERGPVSQDVSGAAEKRSGLAAN